MSENEINSELKTEDINKNASADDYMKKLCENSEKTLFFQRIAAFCSAGVFVVLLVTALIIVPKAVKTLQDISDIAENAQTVVDSAKTTIESASTTLDDVSEMAKSLDQAGDKMGQILLDNESSLADSMEKISNIDFDGLNKGIKDLQDAVGPFANFMKKFN
ncbi:MAG: hypothetical protein E7302_06680 [Butyrivibrio sp.]|nr:hypothetical protein [Butyrivibrio sp.]